MKIFSPTEVFPRRAGGAGANDIAEKPWPLPLKALSLYHE